MIRITEEKLTDLLVATIALTRFLHNDLEGENLAENLAAELVTISRRCKVFEETEE